MAQPLILWPNSVESFGTMTVSGLYDNNTDSPLFQQVGGIAPTSSVQVSGVGSTFGNTIGDGYSWPIPITTGGSAVIVTMEAGGVPVGYTISGSPAEASLNVNVTGGEVSISGSINLEVNGSPLSVTSFGSPAENALNVWLANPEIEVTQGTTPWVVSGTVNSDLYFSDGTPVTYTIVGSPAEASLNTFITGGDVSIGGIVTVTGTVDANITNAEIQVTQFDNIPWITNLTEIGGVAIGYSLVGSPATAALDVNIVGGTVMVTSVIAQAFSAPASYTVGEDVVLSTNLGGALITIPADEQFASYLNYYSANNGHTLQSVSSSAFTPLLSIQSSSAATIYLIRSLQFFSDGSQMLFELVKNPSLTGSTFVATSPSPDINVDTAATVITGGTVIWSGYVHDTGRNVDQLSIALAAGSPGDTFTIAAQASKGSTATGAGVFVWSEQAEAI